MIFDKIKLEIIKIHDFKYKIIKLNTIKKEIIFGTSELNLVRPGQRSTTLTTELSRLSLQDFGAQNFEYAWINYKTNVIFGSLESVPLHKNIFKKSSQKKLKIKVFHFPPVTTESDGRRSDMQTALRP